MERIEKIKWGSLVVAGMLIQIVTSVTWESIRPGVMWSQTTTIGEAYFMCGQAAGELLWLIALRNLLSGVLIIELAVEYAISLIVVDLISILFLNPYEISLSKYAGFVLASFGFLFRLEKSIKR